MLGPLSLRLHRHNFGGATMMGLLGSFVLMLLLPLFGRECEGIGGGGGKGAVSEAAKIAIA